MSRSIPVMSGPTTYMCTTVITAPIFDEKTKIWQDYKCSLENFITVVQGRSGKGRVGLDDSEIIQRIMEEIDEPV